ncbi:Dehydrogenase (flavoprotein) [Ekhidna lutea]|uniref:Dehydrogenase (Flavoprotein) n=1 Tax=Ekhidna lutea TaxID=447679 RepID=A0A239INP9_EKHLU|nr:Dehydrogenase (flavoprotein) [Ekhidna lutea]
MIIIGGGLAGLISAILLRREGFEVVLFEQKKYPFHRVCGEYISNEVVPFLNHHKLFPLALNPTNISQFQLTSVTGKSLEMPLDLGGFGISRKSFDSWLASKAGDEGVVVINDRIVECLFDKDQFNLKSKRGDSFVSDLVIGAFGKRSTLDKSLQRSFIDRRSPYVGVKYHIKTDAIENNKIALHNFKKGYCGLSAVENETYNLCYLTNRSNLKSSGSIPEMEHEVLKKNPFLNHVFTNSDFLFEKPEVINEISFEKKEPVFNHILMTGDSAGMIAPLCGNGMAMAIHSAKMLSELIIENQKAGFDRKKLELEYASLWNQNFAKRLSTGRFIQKLFGSPLVSEITVQTGKSFKPFANYLMKKTHGQPFS